MTSPKGAWPSPLAARRLAAGTLRLSSCRLDRAGRLVWVEGRPGEGGRGALCRQRAAGAADVEDLLPPPWSVRSRVHEYGGVAFTPGEDARDQETLYFFDDGTARLHAFVPGLDPAPRPVTPPGSPWRLADFVVDARRARLIAVGERHLPGMREPENALVVIALDTGTITPLVQGADFYACPRVSPDGAQLAWLCWNHPDMPWDGAELWRAPLDTEGLPGAATRVAGGGGSACFQPEWNARGELVFIDDRDGFWRPYVQAPGGTIRALGAGLPADAECGLPLWQLGMQTWGFLDDDTLALAATRAGAWSLHTVDLRSGAAAALPATIDGAPLSHVTHLCARDGVVGLVAASAQAPTSVVRLAPGRDRHATDTPRAAEVLRRALDDETLALARPLATPPFALQVPGADGEPIHALFHSPGAPADRPSDGAAVDPGARGGLPPLLVFVHGGPTAAAAAALNPAVLYWTSRGFAVAEVNYRGSTGYGRAFRERLNGRWGEADVADCVAVARHLAARGHVDPARLAIRGSSAGGLTVLAALAFHDVFAAGASLYGVTDLAALARDTHKFEAHYLDRLVGPWPQAEDTYRARSPLHHADRIRAPVIFFQGLDDRVVPPAQTEAMADALRARGVPCEAWTFEGEAHGFRRADTLVRVHEAELAFYQRVFGLTERAQARRQSMGK